MKKIVSLVFLVVLITSCKNQTKNNIPLIDKISSTNQYSKIIQENFELRNDSTIYKSATIENFDKEGNSIDEYWIGNEKDTVLKFYSKYDKNMKLIGALYYEERETKPSRDTVYYNSEGLKVVASLNTNNQITWKYITTKDNLGNPVLKTYENGKGEYRGLDSLFFDDKNRVVKGFYKNSRGKRSSIKTYKYFKSDEKGNWTDRKMYVNGILKQQQLRKITYHQ